MRPVSVRSLARPVLHTYGNAARSGLYSRGGQYCVRFREGARRALRNSSRWAGASGPRAPGGPA